MAAWPSIALVLVIVVALPEFAAAQIYRWVDERGTVHYTDGLDSVPAHHRSSATEVRLPGSPAPARPSLPPPASPPPVALPPAEPTPPEEAASPKPSPGPSVLHVNVPPSRTDVLVSGPSASFIARTEYVVYPIAGSTVAELQAHMNQSGPRDSEGRWSARTDSRYTWSYRSFATGAACVVRHVSVEMRILFTFPLWHVPANVPREVIDRWTAAMTGLHRHEEGHKQIALREGYEILTAVGGLQNAISCTALDQSVRQTVAGIQARYQHEQRFYDAQTRHGATQGTNLQ